MLVYFSLLDRIIFVHHIALCFRVLCLYFGVMIITCVASCFEYRVLRKRFAKQLSMNHQRVRCDANEIRQWHSRMTLYLAAFNRRMVSMFSYLYLLSIMPYNVNSVIFIIYGNLSPSLRYVEASFLAVQIGIAIVLAFFFISLNRSIYSSEGLFWRWLLNIERGRRSNSSRISFREHWKSVSYYEMMHRKRKSPLAMTIGPVGTFTRKALIEVKGKDCFL